MSEPIKKLNGIVEISLTKRQAEWLYDLLTETFDGGASSSIDEQNASEIGDKLDSQLGNV